MHVLGSDSAVERRNELQLRRISAEIYVDHKEIVSLRHVHVFPRPITDKLSMKKVKWQRRVIVYVTNRCPTDLTTIRTIAVLPPDGVLLTSRGYSGDCSSGLRDCSIPLRRE